MPKKIMGLGGEIIISLKKHPKVKGVEVAGFWTQRDGKRRIVLNSTIPSRERQHTLYHELVHAALDDSGQHNLLTEQGQEALCDMIATARMREEGK